MATFAQLARISYSRNPDLNPEKSHMQTAEVPLVQKVTSAPSKNFLKIVLGAGNRLSAKLK